MTMDEKRDPRTDPCENDVLYQADGGTKEILVDMVKNAEVYYRVTDGAGGLMAAFWIPIKKWRKLAIIQIREEETTNDDG